ncbi:MAG TPA: POTRA domain-containing protein [Gemmataceae bacterium]|nr:POTRA domain-containing protein [Gemmataceae bacterium]
MVKRWGAGGIWAILMIAAVLICGRNVAAEQPRTPEKVLISDVIIQGNRRMTTEKIKELLHTHPGKEYKESVVNDDVRELYKTYQLSNVQIYFQEDGPGKVKIYFALRELPDDKVAKKVQKVSFLGAKHIKEEDLRRITSVQPGMPLNPLLNLQGCQRIRDKYEEMGRPLATCTLVKGVNGGDTEVVYQITEGPKINVRDIQFVGNTFVSGAQLATQLESLKEWFRLRSGPYHKLMDEAAKHELEKYYRRFGFQDVRVSLETQRSADGRSVTLIYHIHEGPRYRIQDMSEIIVGTQIVPREQLEALSSIKPGDYLDEAETQAIKASDSSSGVVVQAEVLETRIGKIRVTGNKRISTESILAHVPLVPGNVLSYADLREAEEDLAVLDLFVVDKATGVRPTITVIDVEGDSECKDLLITVKEKAKAKNKKTRRSR